MDTEIQRLDVFREVEKNRSVFLLMLYCTIRVWKLRENLDTGLRMVFNCPDVECQIS